MLEESQGAAPLHILGAQVRGHDQDRVAEVHHVALAIGHAAVIQDLQKGIPDFGVRFLDLIEQHHAVWAAADCFRQLAAFLIADIARRRAKQTADRVLLAVFGHIDAHQRVLIVEHEPGQCLRQFGLADARWADKNERADWPGRVFQTGAGAADGIRDGMDGFILTDDAFVQPLFHVQKLRSFGLHHLADRDAGPLMNHGRDVIDVHHFIQLVLRLPIYRACRDTLRPCAAARP